MSHMSIELILTLITLGVGLSCFKNNAQVSIAILISLASARLLTYLNLEQLHYIGMLLAGFVCVVNPKFSWSKMTLDTKGNEINYAISYLYSIRVIGDGAGIAGFVRVEAVWLFSMAILLVQLLLAFGDGVGYGTRINNYLSRFGSRINAFIFH
jgi:hypothetical protein